METMKNELGCVIIKKEKEVIKRNTLEKPKKKTKEAKIETKFFLIYNGIIQMYTIILNSRNRVDTTTTANHAQFYIDRSSILKEGKYRVKYSMFCI